MCHFNKLFVKRSLGTGNSNSDTEPITHVWQSLKIDDETYGAAELNNHIVSGIVSVTDIVSDASVCELGSDQQRKGSILEVDRVSNKKLAHACTCLKVSFITTCQGLLTCVCRRATCNDLYGEAQLKRCIFSGFRYNYERIGISQVEVYEREGKSVI